MKCPICKSNCLGQIDSELVCENCGSAFLLEYVGMYEEGGDERVDDGFQTANYLSQWGTKVNIFKGFIKPLKSKGCGNIFHDDSGSWRCGVHHLKGIKLCEECSQSYPNQNHSQRKKVGTTLGKPLETRSEAEEGKNKDMSVDADNHADTRKGCGTPLSNKFFPHFICGEGEHLCPECSQKCPKKSEEKK